MKHIDIFSSVAEYENAKSEVLLIIPNISFINESGDVKCLPKLEYPTHNGYEYVDLGLPSGLKWATCNVGATSSEQAGLYFAWGETTGYTGADVTLGVRAFTHDEYDAGPAVSISTNLTLEQDAAHVNLGDNWRMPTKAECQELINNCNVVWTDNYNGTGVAGKVFTSKINGNLLFFPAAGCCLYSSVSNVGSEGNYWSASCYSSSKAWYLYFNSGNQYLDAFSRYCGFSVRGVFK